MGAYLGAVWKCRYFWLSLVRMDLRARYRGSVLGIGWSLLHPIAMTAIICIVFTRVLGADLRDYAPFLMAGLTFWNYLVGVSLQGAQCFFQGEAYIRQHPAPMAIYPLRTMLGGGFHFGLALALVLALAGCVRGFSNPWALLTLGPTVLLLLLLGWALATLFGLAMVRFRDTNHLSEVGFQTLFYLSPVMYQPQMLEERGLGILLHVNPVTPFLALLRQPILEGAVPAGRTYLTACFIVAVAVGVAAAALRWEERRLIFRL
jgi:ABC-type polysaccharide/polyol phosphate export permease